ncbi:MAG: hypothetical protein AMK73_05785 [Planctomycetes bacterium SM23_32]|nr:MAG: hypothetical protein AMK73_05785 [Planctomycetes bacterium SM23_32]
MQTSNQNSASGTPTAPMGIPPRVLRPATFPPFDLYVRTDGNGDFHLFRKANEPVYANTWEKLEAGGFDHIYVRAQDRDGCLDYFEENLPAILEEDVLSAREAAQWTYRLTQRAMRSLMDDPDSFRGHKRIKQLAGCLARTMRRHPGAEWDMVDLSPRVYSTEAHSVNVSVLLVSFAAAALGARDGDLLTQIALGGLLHDVGKALIAPDILNKRQGLTRREFAQVKKHPRYGLKICRPHMRDADIGQCIIGQHHENVSGDGYPDGRSGEGINAFARAARIADAFDAMTTDRPYGRAMDSFRALSTMVSEMRGQFDILMLRKFIRHMGSQPRPQTARPAVEAEPAAPQQEPPAPPVEEPPLAEAPATAEAIPEPAPEAPEPAATQEQPAHQPAPQVRPATRTIIRLEPIEEPPEPVVGAASTRASTAEATVILAQGAGPQPAAYAPQPEPYAGSDEETEVAIELQATLDEQRDAIQNLTDEQAETTALMAGLLEALRKSFAGPLGRNMRGLLTGEGAGGPEPTALRSAREVEEGLVRSLFPLIWQIDEWSNQFVPMPNQGPETAAACADALNCLRTLRKGLVGILAEHHVETIEDAAAGARDRSGRVTRVGFLYRGSPKDEVLEPARVVLYPDLRRAG